LQQNIKYNQLSPVKAQNIIVVNTRFPRFRSLHLCVLIQKNLYYGWVIQAICFKLQAKQADAAYGGLHLYLIACEINILCA
jgi:hypothetical protein